MNGWQLSPAASYESVCGRPGCVCATPNPEPCSEFMGGPQFRDKDIDWSHWCPCCGWAVWAHEETSD